MAISKMVIFLLTLLIRDSDITHFERGQLNAVSNCSPGLFIKKRSLFRFLLKAYSSRHAFKPFGQ